MMLAGCCQECTLDSARLAGKEVHGRRRVEQGRLHRPLCAWMQLLLELLVLLLEVLRKLQLAGEGLLHKRLRLGDWLRRRVQARPLSLQQLLGAVQADRVGVGRLRRRGEHQMLHDAVLPLPHTPASSPAVSALTT